RCAAHLRDLHSFPTRRSSDLPLGAVVDVAVGVLLVPGGGVLDLPRTQHGAVQPGELLEALRAGVVHAGGDLVGQPDVELAVLDVELRGQGALVDVLRGPAQIGVDPVVGDPTAQLRAVDDRGDLAVHAV